MRSSDSSKSYTRASREVLIAVIFWRQTYDTCQFRSTSQRCVLTEMSWCLLSYFQCLQRSFVSNEIDFNQLEVSRHKTMAKLRFYHHHSVVVIYRISAIALDLWRSECIEQQQHTSVDPFQQSLSATEKGKSPRWFCSFIFSMEHKHSGDRSHPRNESAIDDLFLECYENNEQKTNKMQEKKKTMRTKCQSRTKHRVFGADVSQP